MSVKELIEALQQLPGDAEVLFIESDGWQDKVDAWSLKQDYVYSDGSLGRILILTPQ